MTALGFLISGALWLALYAAFGQPLIIVLAASLAVLSLIGVATDLRSYAHDRATTMRRFKEWKVAPR